MLIRTKINAQLIKILLQGRSGLNGIMTGQGVTYREVKFFLSYWAVIRKLSSSSLSRLKCWTSFNNIWGNENILPKDVPMEKIRIRISSFFSYISLIIFNHFQVKMHVARIGEEEQLRGINQHQRKRHTFCEWLSFASHLYSHADHQYNCRVWFQYSNSDWVAGSGILLSTTAQVELCLHY